MMKILLVLVVLLEGVSMAPDHPLNTCFDNTQPGFPLKEGLLNNPENLDKIKDKFTFDPNKRKLCIRLNYTITCTDEEECDNATTHFNCSTEYSFANIWLSFDSTTWAGHFLFAYARVNFEVMGLNLGGACDLSPEATLYLSINVSSLCGVGGETYINDCLRILTVQVSTIHQANNFRLRST